jgi:hypothetical protein
LELGRLATATDATPAREDRPSYAVAAPKATTARREQAPEPQIVVNV